MIALNLFDDSNKFYAAIPKDVAANIAFRTELHTQIAADKSLQKIYKEIIGIKPGVAFNSLLWTFNPRLKPGYRNRPFILWDGQEPAIELFHTAHAERFDVAVHKSRDEGATELIRAYLNILFLLDNQMMALVGSEKAEKVDTSVIIDKNYRLSGSPKCLMYKICYGLVTLPKWIRPKITKSYMHLENNDNGAVIDGESTNPNFGLSDRRDVILLDEIGCVEHATAETIISNIPDVCDFNIYNSTHHFGPGHPYDLLLKNPGIHVVKLLWYDNPKKKIGLYETPEIGYVKIKDISYYKTKWPEFFQNVQADMPLKVEEFKNQLRAKFPDRKDDIESISLIADGGVQFGPKRSAWFDSEIVRRGGSHRYIAQNILGEPGGSGKMTFTHEILETVKKLMVRPPLQCGELEYTLDKDGHVTTSKFTTGFTEGRLKWWGKLFNGRPDPTHKYILAVDPARGNGAANAVIGIFDVNTDEEVGLWVCPNTPEERLGDVVWAIRKWIHDNPALVHIIWEANGAGAFENKLIWHGCTNYYATRQERARSRKKKQNKRGWWSTTATKHDLLRELDIAVGRGLDAKPTYKYVRIYDADTIREMESYIESASGLDEPSSLVQESNGARAAHGDRVIPAGLYVLYRKYVKPADVKDTAPDQLSGIAKRVADYKKAMSEGVNKRFIFAR